MRRLTTLLLVLSIVMLSACASADTTASQSGASNTAATLLVSSGTNSKAYTRANLEALGSTQAVFKDVTYTGVTVSALVEDAGFDPNQVKAIKAIATDGFTVNYEPSQVFANDVIVAYACADGDLAEEDGSFRMVLPGKEGKLNVRMLSELQVIK